MTAPLDSYTVASGRGIYGGMAEPEIKEPADVLAFDAEPTFVDMGTGVISNNATYNGRVMVFNLHGSGGQNYTTGRQYRAPVSGRLAFEDQTEFGFSITGLQTAGSSTYFPTMRPIDEYVKASMGNKEFESRHLGLLLADGFVHLTTENRYDALLDWMDANLQQYNQSRRVAWGGSMGAWGVVTYCLRRPTRFAAVYSDRPRFRYGFDWGNSVVTDWSSASAAHGWVDVPYNSAPQIAPEDGGGSSAVYGDMIAHVGNPNNKIPWLGCCLGRNDGYGEFQDLVDFVAACRATGRGFACYWNDGDHSTGSQMARITQSYPIGTFKIGEGYPLFTEHSLDQDPAVDLVGGINIGLSFKNVVETANGWACEVTNVTAACTVKVKPISDVFAANVPAKLVTIPAANTWVYVEFSAV
ncbi:alpha/beta hydrolase-fold protein [Massilia sp. DD77]|uniref:alpha/beta hydrolase-fold protein n=1 Tax=Massilia sp. DD77 TaxID=3109349 RepID=UPI002FFEC251